MNECIVIENGLVVDPANNVQSKLNIVIKHGKIADVTMEKVNNAKKIDATGKVVSPGFIDIHMHEDVYDEHNDKFHISIAEAMLRMGVTTAIGGNCGDNVYDAKGYLESVDRLGYPVNIGLFAGHGTIREKAGQQNKYEGTTPEMVRKMAKMAEEQLEAGCVGISFGVRYNPGTTQEELDALSACCKPYNRIVSSHVRDDAEYIFSAATEFLEMGRKAEIGCQFSHIGSMGAFGQMERLLEMIDTYKLRGLDIHGDCYPYYAFSTTIGATTYDDGFLERYDMDYSQIEICNGIHKGKRCDKEIFDYLRKYEPQAITVAHVMKELEVKQALLHPNIMVASDGYMENGEGHPRAAGTFPKFIAEFVRTGKLSLYDAIAKMTSMQADKLKLTNKGKLSIGADADVLIFDKETIQDTATFLNPIDVPKGIEQVLIGGKIALDKGVIRCDNLGKSVRK